MVHRDFFFLDKALFIGRQNANTHFALEHTQTSLDRQVRASRGVHIEGHGCGIGPLLGRGGNHKFGAALDVGLRVGQRCLVKIDRMKKPGLRFIRSGHRHIIAGSLLALGKHRGPIKC
jgi:hypothetical protein